MEEHKVSSDENVSDLSGTGSESDSDDLAILNIHRLRPYDMEPRRKLEDQDLRTDTERSNDSSDSEAENERIGNNDWCVCGGKCRALETYTESYCCQDTNEIPEDFFKGKIQIIPW